MLVENLHERLLPTFFIFLTLAFMAGLSYKKAGKRTGQPARPNTRAALVVNGKVQDSATVKIFTPRGSDLLNGKWDISINMQKRRPGRK